MKATNSNKVKHAVPNTFKYKMMYVLYPKWIQTYILTINTLKHALEPPKCMLIYSEHENTCK